MHGFRNSFHAALWALVLAIGVPCVLLMFGAIRQRQLHSKANPRWAQFARVTGQQSFQPNETEDLRPAPIPPAVTDFEPVRHSVAQGSLTGSITGHSSVEVPVRSRASAVAKPDRRDDTDDGSFSNVANEDTTLVVTDSPRQLEQELEQQLKEVRSGHDRQLARRRDSQADKDQRQSRAINREAEIENVLPAKIVSATSDSQPWKSTKLRNRQERTDAERSAVEAESSVPLNATEEEFSSAAQSHVLAFDESPQSGTSLSEKITIRRVSGSSSKSLFTMDVHDADIQQFLSKLSEVAQRSILPSPSVTGRISLNLHEVRLDTALNAIMKSRDYVVEYEGDVVIIRTAEESERNKPQSAKNRGRQLRLDRNRFHREQLKPTAAERAGEDWPSESVSADSPGIADRPSDTVVRD